ncbi:MAG: sulfotransferase domain-containing protein, partial [Thermodesulfobacteriota bacterium]|nr:sulfotransferase domain-containing protein [Thermodesulfobacteriota bacterium]
VGSKPILVIGHPRSGISWVGRTLAQAPEALYYHEPCNPLANGTNDMTIMDRYLRKDMIDLQLSALLDKAFYGLPSLRMSWSEKRWRRLFPGYRVVVKEVVTMVSTSWIYRRYKPVLVVVIRHPCAVVLSDLDQGTDPGESLKALLKQKMLVDDHIKPYLPAIKKADTPIEKMGVIWGIRHRILANVLAEHSDANIIYYEDLCTNPLDRFQKLFDSIGLKWSKSVEKYIVANTTKHVQGTYAVSRVTVEQAFKWKKRLTASHAHTVRSLIRPFELPFYGADKYWDIN